MTGRIAQGKILVFGGGEFAQAHFDVKRCRWQGYCCNQTAIRADRGSTTAGLAVTSVALTQVVAMLLSQTPSAFRSWNGSLGSRVPFALTSVNGSNPFHCRLGCGC